MHSEYPLTLLPHNQVKNYQWGSHDPQCYVSSLSGIPPSPTSAELWMGVHPKGQSQLANHQPLSTHLQKNGQKPLDFLFKVLSINKCLSIQVHPNKQQAQLLNKQFNQIYVDNNDKPQMFYTLTQFQCFLGFVSVEKFHHIMSLQPFNSIKCQTQKLDIISVIQELLLLQGQAISTAIDQGLQNLEKIHPDRHELYEHLCGQFPNDIGIVISFFLQYHRIQPYQCYYIPCNTPHAYIRGQCLQIMKNSDNVIRMGLTPKLKDLKVLPSVLTQISTQIGKVQQKQHIFQSNGLYFRIIRDKAAFTVDCHQIGIIIEGQFEVKISSTEEKIQMKKGRVFLLKIGKEYQVRGQGLMCIGWSKFK